MAATAPPSRVPVAAPIGPPRPTASQPDVDSLQPDLHAANTIVLTGS